MKKYLIAALFAGFATAALAEQPRALVMDLSGKVEPAISAFDEINDGALIKLDPDAKISLTFYPTCENLTIKGGSIKIAGKKLSVTGGKIVSKAKGECPGNVALAPADLINASIITRSIRPRPWISPDPSTILAVGAGTGEYTKFSVYSKGEGVIVEAVMKNHKAVWPDGAPKLKPGKMYLFVLTGPDKQMHQARVMVDEKAPRILVLRQK